MTFPEHTRVYLLYIYIVNPNNHIHNRGNSIHIFYIFNKYSNQSNDPKYPKRILPGYAPWRPAVAIDPLGFAPDAVDKGKFALKNGRRKAKIMVVYHICMYIYIHTYLYYIYIIICICILLYIYICIYVMKQTTIIVSGLAQESWPVPMTISFQ